MKKRLEVQILDFRWDRQVSFRFDNISLDFGEDRPWVDIIVP